GQCENHSKSLLDLFGTVVLVKEAGVHLAEQKRTLPCGDWQCYLELCNTLNPEISPEAEYIVRQYFLVNRQYRPACQFREKKSISILFLMSKCIAKLNLRNQVTRHDALLAVMLYEQQLACLFSNTMSPIVFQFRD